MDTEIKIGDEVYLSSQKSLNDAVPRVVVSTYMSAVGRLARTMLPDGRVDVIPTKCLLRTGRNFPQIAEVQKQLKEVWYGKN